MGGLRGMAVCHGPNSPYGCGHHKEHQIAARKGWRTRRRSRAFQGTSEAEALRRSVGDFEGYHTHRTKSGARRHLVKIGGHWFSMPEHEYRGLVTAGRADLRAEKRDKRQAARDALLAPRRREREARRAERHRQEQEKLARRVQRAEHSEVLRVIRANGGIKRNSGGYLHGEYEAIPKHARARAARGVERERGVTMDQAAELVHEHMPWLRIETPRDLLDYFDRVGDVRMARAAQRKASAAAA